MSDTKTHLFPLMFQCAAFGIFTTVTGYFGFNVIFVTGMAWTLGMTLYHSRAILKQVKE